MPIGDTIPSPSPSHHFQNICLYGLVFKWLITVNILSLITVTILLTRNSSVHSGQADTELCYQLYQAPKPAVQVKYQTA